MSADGAAGAPPPAAAPAAETQPRDMGGGIDFGTLDELRKTLGTDALDDGDTGRQPAAEAKAPAEEKPADDTPTVEDADVIKGIMQRSRERHAARRAAQQARSESVVAPPAAEPAAAEAKPKADAKPKSDTAKAVEDVLKELAALAEADEEGGGTKAEKSARSESMDVLKTKLEELVASVKGSDALTAEMTAVKQQLKTMQDATKVREHIAATIDRLADKLPIVSSGTRHEVEIGGRKVRGDGQTLVRLAVERFYDKTGGASPETVIQAARAIEKKLASIAEKNGTAEKQPTRKTVSQSLGSPPAARSGDDTRTAEEALADFNRRFGIPG